MSMISQEEICCQGKIIKARYNSVSDFNRVIFSQLLISGITGALVIKRIGQRKRGNKHYTHYTYV